MTWIRFLSEMADLIWSAPVVFLLLGVYLYISCRAGFPQRRVFRGLGAAFSGNRAVRRSLSVSLAAVLGVGNIVGVAMAISLGGPGAVFWCWLAGFAGMGVQYAECLCSLRHRQTEDLPGGPMVSLRAMGFRGSAWLYAAAAVLCGLTMGALIPANSIRTVLIPYGGNVWIVAIILAALTALVLVGGAGRIFSFCIRVIPLLVLFYVAACGAVLLLCRDAVGEAIRAILTEAFSLPSALAGTAGYGIGRAARWGVARGLFSSEAGLGTAGISAASADAEDPETQALGCACQSVWDTMILATLTGVTFVTAALSEGYGFGDPMLLARRAFSMIPLVGEWLLPVFLVVLGFSTIIGWYYIARQAWLYLTGLRAGGFFALLWIVSAAAGVFLLTELAWTLSDLFSMLMLVPNLRMLLLMLRREPRVLPGKKAGENP